MPASGLLRTRLGTTIKRAGHRLGTLAVLDGDQQVSATLGGGHPLHTSCSTGSTHVRLCSPDGPRWALLGAYVCGEEAMADEDESFGHLVPYVLVEDHERLGLLVGG